MKNLALPLLLFAVLYVVLILPQSRRRKQALALQRAVGPGSKVMLTSGLFGTVVEIDDDAVVVEAAEGVHLRYAKAAVLRVIPDAVELDDTDINDGDIDDGEVADPEDREARDDADATDAALPASDTSSKPKSGTDGNDAGSGSVPTS